MKKLLRRICNMTFSLITTCLIMAAPVAAMVYASEPVAAVESFSIREAASEKYIDSGKIEYDPHLEKTELTTSTQDALTEKE